MKFATVVVFCLALAASQAKPSLDLSDLVELPILDDSDGPSSGSGRITGGVEVPPNALPYQVGLFIEVSQGTAFCGGSIISEEWILTAAHCAQPGSSFEVVMGAHYIRDVNETTQVRMITTEKIVHPDWSRLTLLNDVALLKLPTPVVFNDNIKAIRLPSIADVDNMFDGTEALMSGWGLVSDEATAISDTLQAINKTVINQTTCERRYPGVLVEEAHICTEGSLGQSTCSGDSGGPLVYREEDGKPTQIGTVSFGISLGCEINWPPVFARVTSYVKWILQNTGIPNRP